MWIVAQKTLATTFERIKLFISGCLLLVGCSAQADWFSADEDIMGTRISIELWDDSAEHANQVIAAVMAEMHRIDNRLSPYKDDSELSKLNRQAIKQPVKVSDELFYLLQQAHKVSELTEGAFDVTFGSVGRYYDYRQGKAPSDEEIAEHLKAIDYRSLIYDEKNQTVLFQHADTYVDLGGIAKGYAVDRGIEIVRKASLVSAIVIAGGDSKILGNRGDRPWMVGIRDPRSESREDYAIIIPLEDVALSTSGDYERFFMKGGERVHHIISPQTGRSASTVRSVSILADQGVFSDALSTSVFVMGIEKGLELVNRLDGIDAIIIDQNGKLHFSDGLLEAE